MLAIDVACKKRCINGRGLSRCVVANELLLVSGISQSVCAACDTRVPNARSGAYALRERRIL
jgi:hypothetical protein